MLGCRKFIRQCVWGEGGWGVGRGVGVGGWVDEWVGGCVSA